MGMHMINAARPARIDLIPPGARQLHFLALRPDQVWCGVCRQTLDKHVRGMAVTACER